MYIFRLSGSWDKTVSVWDERQYIKSHSLKLPGKVYDISTSEHHIVIATSDRHIVIYDIRNLNEPETIRESPLKNQTRRATCSSDGSCYAVGSTEGRLGVEYFDNTTEIQSKKYAFKCHRLGEYAYPINSIKYHPFYGGTFATGGCDGIVNIWDGLHRKRLCQLGPYPTSIAAMAFR